MQFVRFRWSAPVWFAGLLVSFHLYSLDVIAGAFQGGSSGSNRKSGTPPPVAARLQRGNGRQEQEECVYENFPLSSSARQPDHNSSDTGTTQDGGRDRNLEQRQHPTYMNVLQFRSRPTEFTPSQTSSTPAERSEHGSGSPAAQEGLPGRPQAFPEHSATGTYDRAGFDNLVSPENSTGTDGGASESELVYEVFGTGRQDIEPVPHVSPTYISYVGDVARRDKREPVYATIPMRDPNYKSLPGGGARRDNREHVYATIPRRDLNGPPVVRSLPGVDKGHARMDVVASAEGNVHGLPWGDHVYEEVGDESVVDGRRRAAAVENLYTEVGRLRQKKSDQHVAHPQRPSRQDNSVSATATDADKIYEALPLHKRQRYRLRPVNAAHTTKSRKRGAIPDVFATGAQMQPISTPATQTEQEHVYDVSLPWGELEPTVGEKEEPLYENVPSFWGDVHRLQSDNDVYPTGGNMSGRRAADREVERTHSSVSAASTEEAGDYGTWPLRTGGTETPPLQEEDIYGPVGGAGASYLNPSLFMQQGEHNREPADGEEELTYAEFSFFRPTTAPAPCQEQTIYAELPLLRGGARAEDMKTNLQPSLLERFRRAFKLKRVAKESHSDDTQG